MNMRAMTACILLIALSSVEGARHDEQRVKKQLKSDNYTVTWRTAVVNGADAVLEIGEGNGHGGTLRWLRLKPGKDAVDVLSIQFDKGWRPYKSRWPPDRASAHRDTRDRCTSMAPGRAPRWGAGRRGGGGRGPWGRGAG